MLRIIAALAVLCLPALALAQDDTAVSVAPLVDFVLPILFTVISGIVTVMLPILLTKLATKFNLQIEQEKRDALQVTFTNAAGGLVQALGDRARLLKIDVGNPHVRDAIARALQGSPEALLWAGLSSEEIARRILEKIPQITQATGSQPAIVEPVSVAAKETRP
jgi:hypothetical protein